MAFSLVGLGPCRLLPGGASGRAGYMQVTTCMSRTGSSVPGVQPLALRARLIYDAHHMSTATAGQTAPSRKEVTHERIVRAAALGIRPTRASRVSTSGRS